MDGDIKALRAVHVLVDLENNQPTLEEVRALVPDLTDVWLFHSGKQSKHLTSFAPLAQRQTPVPISRPGKNSLDFHLAFYLGYLASRNPGARLVVVAIDGGYQPMIEHALALGFDVRRAPFRAAPAKKAPGQKSVKPAAKKAKTTPKKAVTKVAAKSAKKAPKAASKATPKVPAKKAVTKKVKKAAPAAAKPTSPVATSGVDDKLLDRLAKGLRKMGDKAPTRLKAYRQHLKSMLGQGASDQAVDEFAAALDARGTAKVDGKAVKYGFAGAKA
jgi:PIN domain